MTKNRITTSFLLLLLFCVALIPTKTFAEEITFSANSMTGKAGSKNSTTTLKGNAHVKTEKMEVTAEMIELSGKDFRFIKAEGNVSGSNTESNTDFACQKLSYDRNTKIILLSGDVTFTDVENEVESHAEIIEYNQNKETAVMQIRVNLTQKDNVCTSAHAIYRKNEQLLEMSGNPKIVQGEDTFRAQTIILDMDTQEITLTGRVNGTVSTEEEVEEEEEEELKATDEEEKKEEAEEEDDDGQ